MDEFYFDFRWQSTLGIGRFAREVRKRVIGMTDLPQSGSPSSALDCFRTAWTLRKRKARGFFSPGFNVPVRASCPVICTVHDLIHIHDEQQTSLLKKAYYSRIQGPILRQSPLVLTVSQFSKSQLCDWFDIPEERVRCVGNGISTKFSLDGAKFKADLPYFLYVGNCRSHKNLGVLIQAFSRLKNSEAVNLIMVTKPDKKLLRTIDEFNVGTRVSFVLKISDEKLATYYRSAIATILPSTFEGFGLPLVEAFACGCPVIGSNVTSIPEVIGDAGLLFDPYDCDDLTEKLSLLVNNNCLRSDLIKKGLSRANLYQWDNVGHLINDALVPFVGKR